MDSFLIFISLTILGAGYYFVWPSRYNVMTHLTVGGVFISSFVPAMVLSVQENFPLSVADLYIKIILTGSVVYLLGLYVGFKRKVKKTRFSFDVMTSYDYENRVIKITKILLVTGLVSLTLSYMAMGFVPIFAADPVSAKFFRGPYQQPYLRVASLYRTSFYILSTIIPITSIIWYKKRSKFFLYGTLAAICLMFLSLSRSPAFSGLVLALALVMSFKSKFHFRLLLCLIIGIFLFSSVFYYIIGVKTFEGGSTDYWQVIGESAPDISDQLQFMEMFIQNPNWTYGRTIYGGLIPGHYRWNPSVYSLSVIAPEISIDEIVSGGLRLPAPIWGYVSFEWFGVIIFSLLSGLLSGISLRYTKSWLMNTDSLIIRAVIVVIFMTVFLTFINFYTLSIFSIPPMAVMILYMYRFKFNNTL